jgi:hypothetical protein
LKQSIEKAPIKWIFFFDLQAASVEILSKVIGNGCILDAKDPLQSGLHFASAPRHIRFHLTNSQPSFGPFLRTTALNFSSTPGICSIDR